MKKHASFLILLIFMAALISSCKKSEENTDSTPQMPEEEINEGRTVQDDKSPRSEQKEGEFTFEEEIVTSPVNLQNDADASAKIEILTAGTDASSAKLLQDDGIYGWYAEYFGDEWVQNEYIYFFKPDGTYLYYNQESEIWDWGYYYVNLDLTMLVTDYDSEMQKWWIINELTPTKCVWTHKTEGEITLTGFKLENF